MEMCNHGTETTVTVVNPDKSNKTVKVDSCISNEIQLLNNQGVVTLGCCCGHGKAGQIVEYENKFGKWKEYHEPPIALIKEESVQKSKELGYKPYPHYQADGQQNGVWGTPLKTGCITKKDCQEWHVLNEEESK